MDNQRLRQTAYHEAGHSVVAVLYGLKIFAATVREGVGSYGQTIQPLILRNGVGVQETVRKHIVTSYAGYAAERLFRGGVVNYWQSHDDSMDALSLAEEFLNEPYRLQSLREEAQEIVAREWRAIAALANALLERKTLIGEEIEKIVRPLLVGAE